MVVCRLKFFGFTKRQAYIFLIQWHFCTDMTIHFRLFYSPGHIQDLPVLSNRFQPLHESGNRQQANAKRSDRSLRKSGQMEIRWDRPRKSIPTIFLRSQELSSLYCGESNLKTWSGHFFGANKTRSVTKITKTQKIDFG